MEIACRVERKWSSSCFEDLAGACGEEPSDMERPTSIQLQLPKIVSTSATHVLDQLRV
jgi:hypothetical protein